MEKIFRKIFWGVILATIHIRIGAIKILPSFIGWIIVLVAVVNLGNNPLFKEVTRLKFTGIVLVISSIVHEGMSLFFPLALGSHSIWLFNPTVLLLIEFILFHKILEETVYMFQEMNRQVNSKKFINRDRAYIILMALTFIFLLISFIFFNDFIAVIGRVLFVIARLYLIFIFYSLSKQEFLPVYNESLN